MKQKERAQNRSRERKKERKSDENVWNLWNSNEQWVKVIIFQRVNGLGKATLGIMGVQFS